MYAGGFGEPDCYGAAVGWDGEFGGAGGVELGIDGGGAIYADAEMAGFGGVAVNDEL